MPESRAIRAGDRVGIPAGTSILSDFHPDAEPGATVARDQTVMVNHLSSRETSGKPIKTIRWPGSGGYWREVAVADVELLTDRTTPASSDRRSSGSSG